MKKTYLFTLVFLFALTTNSQAQLAMGKWRTHFAFNQVEKLAQSPNKVFAVSEGKLFSIDKRDKSIEYYSKVSGLSGNHVSDIGYDSTTQTLLILYADGNIDFLSAGGIYNLPDFYSKQMSADKSVNDILFHNGNAYLATKFGIMVINMEKMEIKDTYFIGPDASEVEIFNITIHNNIIYATTATAIYSADINNSKLISYEHWNRFAPTIGAGGLQTSHSFGDWLVHRRGFRLYKQDLGGAWSSVELNENIIKTEVSGSYLIAHSATNTYLINSNFEITQISNIHNLTAGIYDNVTDVFWLAGNNDGIIEFANQGNSINYYKPNGPASNLSFKLLFGGERLFMFQGGRWEINYSRPGIVMIFENNQWETIHDEGLSDHPQFRALDFMSAAINPQDNKHFFVSSYGNGILEFKNDKFFEWHTIDNSTIRTIFPDADNLNTRYNYMRTDGGTFDKDGNIWFSNSGVSGIYQVRKSNGSWTEFLNPTANSFRTASEILIPSKTNHKWIFSMRDPQGILVLDDNGTIDDKSDDNYVHHRSLRYHANDETQTITPNYYYCMVEDKNGAVWIGTDYGPFIINNPAKVFDNDFMVTRIIIPRNDGTGLGDFLLEDQEITAIAVDGANRKWIGTRETGVYLLSENGLETIHHFTADNSPLISNEILSIATHPTSGEVFIGTGNGLISYKSDAADGNRQFTNVHAYPNPVRENFNGIITIAGLIDNTQVKIVDTAGNLVFETKSNGSLATWNGKNKWGEKVSTGVYIALCVTPDGQETTQVKILIIN